MRRSTYAHLYAMPDDPQDAGSKRPKQGKSERRKDGKKEIKSNKFNKSIEKAMDDESRTRGAQLHWSIDDARIDMLRCPRRWNEASSQKGWEGVRK